MWRFELVDTYKSVLEDITEEQEQLLEQFRASLDVELTPRYTNELLFKFLRTKNFNLKAAKKVFLEDYYNRILFGVNTILDKYQKPEVAVKYESSSFFGFARDGTLVRYMAAGRLDIYGFIMSMSNLNLGYYFVHLMEQDVKTLEEQNSKTGRNVTEMTYIVDLEGFSLQQVLHKCVLEMGMDFTRLMQDCYPEIWRHILIVNAPKVFHTAFNIFKPVIRPTIRDKIKIVDKDSTKYTLLRHIDEDVLPAFLGGNRSDSKGDVLCREFVSFGGPVPEALYSRHCRTPLSLEEPGVRLVHIGPGSVFNLVAAVREAGSTLRLQMSSEDGSVEVSIFYREFGPDTDDPVLPGENDLLEEDCGYKQVSVQLRNQIHCTQEDGQVQAPWPGIYVARIGNTGSWFTPRKVFLKLTCSST